MANMNKREFEETKLHSPVSPVNAKNIGEDGDHIEMKKFPAELLRLSGRLAASGSPTINELPNGTTAPSDSTAVSWTKEVVDGGINEEKIKLMLKDGTACTVVCRDEATEAKERVVMLNLDCSCRTYSSRVGHLVNVILVISNMLNYMDRYTIAGIYF